VARPSEIDAYDACCGFDYSTLEGQAALRRVTDATLETRRVYVEPLTRRIALYERTLGLAVVPVLIHRAVIALISRSGLGPRGTR